MNLVEVRSPFSSEPEKTFHEAKRRIAAAAGVAGMIAAVAIPAAGLTAFLMADAILSWSLLFTLLSVLGLLGLTWGATGLKMRKIEAKEQEGVVNVSACFSLELRNLAQIISFIEEPRRSELRDLWNSAVYECEAADDKQAEQVRTVDSFLRECSRAARSFSAAEKELSRAFSSASPALVERAAKRGFEINPESNLALEEVMNNLEILKEVAKEIRESNPTAVEKSGQVGYSRHGRPDLTGW